jgi:hypothetical protein
MLLRRITKHVKDQNWFAVGIDFFIVVIGVFIGIQVANWNEAQVDRGKAELVLERLEADFGHIETASLEAIDHTNQSISIVEKLMTKSVQRSLILSEALETGQLEAIAYFRGPVRGSSTYDELKSAGELRFIRSEALRSRLADFERTRVMHVAANQYILDLRGGMAPTLSQQIDMLDAARVIENEHVSEIIVSVTDEALETREFQKELSGFLTHFIAVKYWHEQTLADVREVLNEMQSTEKIGR